MKELDEQSGQGVLDHFDGQNSLNDDLRPSVVNAVRTMVQKIQYELYDPQVDQIQTTKKLQHVPDVLAAVKKESHEQGIHMANIGPAVITSMDSMVAPYAYCSEKPRALAEIPVSDIATLIQGALLSGTRDVLTGKTSLERMSLRTVFGASEVLPVRALSYLLPSLHLAEAMRRSNKFSVLPQIQFMIMGESAATMNGLDVKKVRMHKNMLVYLGKAYVETFYPELARYVVFGYDTDFLTHPVISELQKRMITDERVKQHKMYPAVAAGLAHIGSDTAYQYAILHPLVHDVAYDRTPFETITGTTELDSQPTVLINIGGQREKLFYQARMMYRDILEEYSVPLMRSVQLFSQHRTPPYLPILPGDGRMGDITSDDVLEDTQRLHVFNTQLREARLQNNLLYRDYELLTKDVYPGNFIDFATTVLHEIQT